MKVIVVVLFAVVATLAKPDAFAAEKCSQENNCLAADGCRCSDKNSPIDVAATPQFVTLAFNDAVTEGIYNEYLEPLLFHRVNPDGNRIGATFFVPHEYTDYEKVNALYNLGFEIAVHSISKNALSSYWQEADAQLLYDEFYGQRQICSVFANIPLDDVIGARTPNLELNGDATFQAYQEAGIQYDNSWTAHDNNRFYPYTLDYASNQPCLIGKCPQESFPGTWVLPIIDLTGTDGNQCNSLLGCVVAAEEPADVTNWLMEQFNKHYDNNRAPMTLTVNSAWFLATKHNYEGFIGFLDQLAGMSEVFLISHQQLLDWSRNPQPLGEYTSAVPERSAECPAKTCPLLKGEETRYMRCCVTDCPDVYPWVGNPLGEELPEPTEEPEETDSPTEEPQTEEPTTPNPIEPKNPKKSF